MIKKKVGNYGNNEYLDLFAGLEFIDISSLDEQRKEQRHHLCTCSITLQHGRRKKRISKLKIRFRERGGGEMEKLNVGKILIL